MMSEIKRSDFWELTIRYDVWKNPTTTIHFTAAPTRQDFESVVECTPWMHVWKANLLPLIKKNPWPYLDMMRKAGSQELIDENGQIVGQLSIHRKTLWENDDVRRSIPVIRIATMDKISKGTQNPDKSFACIRRSQNVIRERLLEARRSDEAQVEYEMRLVLHENDLLKTCPKEPEPLYA